MSETPNTTDQTLYFYYVHVEYSHKLDRPVTEHITGPDGYIVGTKTREYETGQTHNAGTLSFPTGHTVTRFELFLKAREFALAETNKGRAARGQLLFRTEDMIIKAFECGRNEL